MCFSWKIFRIFGLVWAVQYNMEIDSVAIMACFLLQHAKVSLLKRVPPWLKCIWIVLFMYLHVFHSVFVCNVQFPANFGHSLQNFENYCNRSTIYIARGEHLRQNIPQSGGSIFYYLYAMILTFTYRIYYKNQGWCFSKT